MLSDRAQEYVARLNDNQRLKLIALLPLLLILAFLDAGPLTAAAFHVLVVYYALNLVWWGLLRAGLGEFPAFLLIAGTDVALVTYIVYLTGPLTSVAVIFYFIYVNGFGMFFNRRRVFGIAIVSALTYLGIVLAAFFDVIPYAPVIPELAAFLGVIPAEYLVIAPAAVILMVVAAAVSSGFQHNQLEQSRDALADANASLEDTNRKLREVDALKSNYLSVVSHDLRAPMTSLRAFGEILRDEDDLSSADRRRYANIVITESDRLTRLVTDLLDIDKMEAGEMEWNMQPWDVIEVLTEVSGVFDGMAQTKAVRFEREFQTVPNTLMDKDRISQVVANLLSNAFKFTEQGRVTLACRHHDSAGIQVSVCDTGPGIPDDRVPFIFDRFAQVAAGDSARGTGLGLTIAKEIVEHHGGRIWVDSAVGRGSDFHFVLPVAHSAPAAPAP